MLVTEYAKVNSAEFQSEGLKVYGGCDRSRRKEGEALFLGKRSRAFNGV